MTTIFSEVMDFEEKKFISRSDKIAASREAKRLILGLNEIYKQKKDPSIMEVMKRLTTLKRKYEKRL
ncbi:hypothetical protein H2O64_04965 [Kordia sp. YSTF-M3]|uniref:Uncharacterized protein n=1 Tax=Kordia aestuariivivens TaxID=2759037 RepID=A0ABR7Q627_9FLAO|nr:hypothetical protein [Kordia aestuariivivens]MBC8754010.1 hypothetical protein [Kordia aestuariivivens]